MNFIFNDIAKLILQAIYYTIYAILWSIYSIVKLVVRFCYRNTLKRTKKSTETDIKKPVFFNKTDMNSKDYKMEMEREASNKYQEEKANKQSQEATEGLIFAAILMLAFCIFIIWSSVKY